MKFTAKKTNQGIGIWSIIFDGESWLKLLSNAKITCINNLQVQGFRKGKVPSSLIDKYLSEQEIINEASRMAIKKGYKYALEQKTDVQPISQMEPARKATKTKCLVEFKFDIKPEIKIGKYTGIKTIKKNHEEVSSKIVNSEIKKLQEKYAILNVKKGVVAKGNHVLIDFIGKIDGKEFKGGKALNYGLDIGSGQFIPGFEEAIIGMKPKTKKTIKVTFPKDYQATEFQGKEATFEVTLKEIKIKKVPSLNEEFIEDLKIKGVKTPEELKVYVKENLQDQFNKAEESKFIEKLLEEISKDSNIIIPKSMIVKQAKLLFDNFAAKVQEQKITMEDYMKQTGLTMENINSELENDARKMLRDHLILVEVIRLENIKVNKSEIEDKYNELALKFGVKSTDKILKNILPEEKITESIEKNKVSKFLFQNNG